MLWFVANEHEMVTYPWLGTGFGASQAFLGGRFFSLTRPFNRGHHAPVPMM